MQDFKGGGVYEEACAPLYAPNSYADVELGAKFRRLESESRVINFESEYESRVTSIESVSKVTCL